MRSAREQASVLILGDHGSHLSQLAERVRGHGFRAIRAKTAQDAIALASERGFRFAAGLVDASLPALDLRSALDELRTRTGSHRMFFLATGSGATKEQRERLREAGVQHAIFEPIGDNALLFQLNHAVTGESDRAPRGDPRAPTDWTTRVVVAGRAKRASVYSLSAGGAFLATGRPLLRGAELALDLPLPDGVVSLLGQVLYTNVPGNLSRSRLPTGMGVCFVRTPPEDRERIYRSVEQAACRFYV